MPTETAHVPSPAIVDRPGQRRGFLGTAWPVTALALLLRRACVLAMQGAPVPPLTRAPAGSGAAR